MFGLSIWELAIIAAIILVVFGAKRLPGLGKALGETVNEVKGWRSDGPSTGKEGADEPSKSSPTKSMLPEISELSGLRTTQGKIRLLSRFFRR